MTAGPTPGWYPDPSGPAGYRWWNGSSWEAAVSPRPGPPPRPRRSGWSIALLVTAGVLLAWAGLWLIMLPLLAINDADNGRAGHDFRSLWIPEFLPALVTAIACIVVSQTARRGRLLALPVLLVVATIVIGTIAFAAHTK